MINLSGNEMSPSVVEAALKKLSNGFHLQSCILHTNNLGSSFNTMKQYWISRDFVDLGNERLYFLQ